MGNSLNTDIEYKERLFQAIKTISSDFSLADLSLNLVLNTIPEWDSLTAINFSISIEKLFGLSEGSVVFTGEDSIETIIVKIKAVEGKGK